MKVLSTTKITPCQIKDYGYEIMLLLRNVCIQYVDRHSSHIAKARKTLSLFLGGLCIKLTASNTSSWESFFFLRSLHQFKQVFICLTSWGNRFKKKCSAGAEIDRKLFTPHQPFHSQDLISNSPYYLPYNSYDVSSENLVLDQLIIPWLIFFSILITCLLDIVLTL